MSYDNTNTGLLARNTRKSEDNHPDHTGTININGTDYWLSAWIKTGREGSKLAGQRYFSLSVKPKSPPAAPAAAPVATTDGPAIDADDIPF